MIVDTPSVALIPPADTLLRHIPPIDPNFTSLSNAPYPPCPSTHVNQLSSMLNTPWIDSIITSVYDKHDTSPYLDTVNFDSDAFSSVPSTLLNPPQHIRNIPPSDRVSSIKIMTTEFLQNARDSSTLPVSSKISLASRKSWSP